MKKKKNHGKIFAVRYILTHTMANPLSLLSQAIIGLLQAQIQGFQGSVFCAETVKATSLSPRSEVRVILSFKQMARPAAAPLML